MGSNRRAIAVLDPEPTTTRPSLMSLTHRGALAMAASFVCGKKVDLNGLRFDDHTLDMAFDQIAVRDGREGLLLG
jgi:hypothetical protein